MHLVTCNVCIRDATNIDEAKGQDANIDQIRAALAVKQKYMEIVQFLGTTVKKEIEDLPFCLAVRYLRPSANSH